MKPLLTLLLLISLSASAQHIEAENYSAMYGIKTETTSDSAGGKDVGYIDAGDWTEYVINPPVTGSYTLNLRVANPYNQPQIDVMSGTAVLGTFRVPVTGGWQTFKTYSIKVNLTAGSQTIRMFYANGGCNINWFEFISPVTTIPTTGAFDFSNYISLPQLQSNFKSFYDSTNFIVDTSDFIGNGKTIPFYVNPNKWARKSTVDSLIQVIISLKSQLKLTDVISKPNRIEKAYAKL